MEFSKNKTPIVLPSIFLLLLYLLFSSCKSQPAKIPNSSSTLSHDTSEELGKIVDAFDLKITQIYQTKNGDYWFGSNDQGAYQYYKSTNGKMILKQYNTEDGLASNRIRSIREDKAGNIYLDCLDGINKYIDNRFKTLKFHPDSESEWRISDEDLWFEGDFNKDGVYRYDGVHLHRMRLPTHELEAEIYRKNPDARYLHEVYHIYQDRQKNIWIGGATLGAMRFDGKNKRWLSEREMTEVDPGPAPGVRSILEDREGNFWFSSNVNHKYKILQTGSDDGHNLNYEKLKGIEIPLSEQGSLSYMAMIEDNHGDIWFASYTHGVDRYDGEKFVNLPVQINGTNAEIFTIYKDKQGGIWLGTFNLGPLKFNGTTFEQFKP